MEGSDDRGGGLIVAGAGECTSSQREKLPAESGSTTDQASEEDADHSQSLIMRLPRDLFVKKVLPCLPLPKIYELRCVSRRWNSLLASPYVLQQCIAGQKEHQPWLVMSRWSPLSDQSSDHLLSDKDFIAYVPSLGRWFPFPFHLFPAISTLIRSQKYRRDFDMTSAGGLICCMLLCDGNPTTVVVFNPLNGNMKVLPPFRAYNECGYSLSMLHDQALNSYKVVLTPNPRQGGHCLVQIYDSNNGSWNEISISPHISTDPDIQSASLFLYLKLRGGCYTLYGYHMESDKWSSVTVPHPDAASHSCWFADETYFPQKVNGRVLLAFDQSKWSRVHSKRLQIFSIWEFKCSAASWVQLVSAPPKFWRRPENRTIRERSKHNTSFIINGRLICMTAADPDDPPLVYDFHCNTWYQLPLYKAAVSQGTLSFFSFQPTSNTANTGAIS